MKGVHVSVEGSAPVVLADAELLKIVFQNLLINGAQAMGGTGELRVVLAASSNALFRRLRGSGSGHSGGHSRKDLCALLYDKGAGHRPRTSDRKTVDRGAKRDALDSVPSGRRHDGHRAVTNAITSSLSSSALPA